MNANPGATNAVSRRHRFAEHFSLESTLKAYEVEELTVEQIWRFAPEIRVGTGRRYDTVSVDRGSS
jgi:hypothetical protein